MRRGYGDDNGNATCHYNPQPQFVKSFYSSAFDMPTGMVRETDERRHNAVCRGSFPFAESAARFEMSCGLLIRQRSNPVLVSALRFLDRSNV